MNRSKLKFFGIFLSVLLFFVLFNQNQANAATFYRTLSLGMSGEDVRALQVILNSDPDTILDGVGPGSKGQESTYFGSLTQNAVIRFQEKYAQAILVPLGLESGTGTVGPSTLKYLGTLAAPNSAVNPIVRTVAVAVATSSNSISTTYNPNLKNRDSFMAAMSKLAQKKNIDPSILSKVTNQMMIDTSTTTDLRKRFVDVLNSSRGTSQNSESMFSSTLSSFVDALSSALTPEVAEAFSSEPFGGSLLYAYPCVCSYNWLIYVTPGPPTDVALLTYTPYTQKYNSHNIPFTQTLLGYYTEDGTCSVYIPPYECYDIPAEGDIDSTVGSSGGF